MCGKFRDQGGLFSYVDPESRIPARHPLRQNPGAGSGGLEGHGKRQPSEGG